MEIVVSSHKQLHVPGRLREQAMEKAQRAFTRIGHLIRRLDLRLDDVNGPKGGVCKRCHAVLSLADGGVVTIEHRHHALGGAIAKAIERAQRTLLRRTEKGRRMKQVSASGLPT